MCATTWGRFKVAETSIQWTATQMPDGTWRAGYTFNPWTRCTKASPACDFCYAETWAGRATHPVDSTGMKLPLWGDAAPRDMTSDHYWRQPLRWNREAKESGVRSKVFCASLADVFEEHPAITASEARERLWLLIEVTPWLDWMLLTKRPENIMLMIPERWRKQLPANVWVGCTAENQEWAEKRIPHLLMVPAVVRFLSIEPMLGPVDLTDLILHDDGPGEAHYSALECDVDVADDGEWLGKTVNLVIVGGESGPHARPMHPAWVRSVRDQCSVERVPFHFKQHGEWEPVSSFESYMDGIEAMCDVTEWKKMSHKVAIVHYDGRVEKPEAPYEQWWNDFADRNSTLLWAAGLEDWLTGKEPWVMHFVGKHAAGRTLDDRTWDEMPVTITSDLTKAST